MGGAVRYSLPRQLRERGSRVSNDVAGSANAEPDLVDCRKTLVPAIGVYSTDKNSHRLRGSRTGIQVNAITCAPLPDDGEEELGLWSASEADLRSMYGDGDRGPLSGVALEYQEKLLISARQRLLLTPNRLLGAAEGRTVWGDSGGSKAGRIVVWQWNFEHIHEISTYRIRKYRKMWDAGLTIVGHEPQASFDFSALGPDAHTFRSRDDRAKSARVDKSDVLGFATLLASVAAKATGRSVSHTNDNDAKEPVDTFKLV